MIWCLHPAERKNTNLDLRPVSINYLPAGARGSRREQHMHRADGGVLAHGRCAGAAVRGQRGAQRLLPKASLGYSELFT